MTSLKEWIGYIEPEGPADPSAILRATRDALGEFCEISTIWREETERVSTVADTVAYTLRVPDWSAIVDVLELEYDDLILTPATEKELDVIYGIGSDLKGNQWMWGVVTGVQGWRALTATSPEYFYLLPTRQIRLVPIPTTALTNGLTPRVVVLKPSYKAMEVPEFLFEHYRDDIALGAKARLLKQSNVPWSNPRIGEEYYQQFVQKAAQAKMRADSSNLMRNVVVGSTLFGGYEGEG